MPTINLRTPIPGPKSQDLMRRRNAAVARGVAHATPIFAARAEGAMLEDVDGNRYIDFAGGIGCLNAGHRAPGVLAAIRGQLDAFLHTCFSVAPYGKYIELAEKLNSLTPGKFPKKTLLVNSGAEAIENSVKIARSYTHRPAIICFEDAFHGRTMLTMSLTSKTHPYKAGFEPFATDIYRIPYAYCYRCSYSLQYPDCGVFCAKHLEDTFKRVVASETVAAVIVEPVLGEGRVCRAATVSSSRSFRIFAGGTRFCLLPTKYKQVSVGQVLCSLASDTASCQTCWCRQNRSVEECRSRQSRAVPRSWIHQAWAGSAEHSVAIPYPAQQRLQPSKSWSTKISLPGPRS